MAKSFPNKEQTFKKGRSGNPKGRPRKGVSAVLSALEAAGHDEVTAEQVRATMGRMLNLSRAELVKRAMDQDTPILDLLVAKALAHNQKGWDNFQDILDRLHGKSKQAVDLTTGGERLTVNINAPNGRPDA